MFILFVVILKMLKLVFFVSGLDRRRSPGIIPTDRYGKRPSIDRIKRVATGERDRHAGGYRQCRQASLQRARLPQHRSFRHSGRGRYEQRRSSITISNRRKICALRFSGAPCDYAEHLIGPTMAQESPGGRLTFLLDRMLQLNDRPEWSTCQMVATLCAELTIADGRLREAVQVLQNHRLEALADMIRKAQEAGEVDPQADPLVWGRMDQLHVHRARAFSEARRSRPGSGDRTDQISFVFVVYRRCQRRLTASSTERGAKKP